MEEVTELLGYIYETEGTVVHGDARGRLLGFPTANVKVKSTVRLPRIGVYAVQIEVGGNGMLAWAQLVIMTPLEKAAI